LSSAGERPAARAPVDLGYAASSRASKGRAAREKDPQDHVEEASKPDRIAHEGPDEPVPLFGSWPRAYACVVATALAVMALVALFSRWPF